MIEGILSLLRGHSDQCKKRKARGQDGYRDRDLGDPEADRPAKIVLVALGHVGPQPVQRRFCFSVICFHAFLQHGVPLFQFRKLLDQILIIISAMFISYPIAVEIFKLLHGFNTCGTFQAASALWLKFSLYACMGVRCPSA